MRGNLQRNYVPVLREETINPHLLKAQYAVRGELAIRAEQLKEVTSSTGGELWFNQVNFDRN